MSNPLSLLADRQSREDCATNGWAQSTVTVAASNGVIRSSRSAKKRVATVNILEDGVAQQTKYQPPTYPSAHQHEPTERKKIPREATSGHSEVLRGARRALQLPTSPWQEEASHLICSRRKLPMLKQHPTRQKEYAHVICLLLFGRVLSLLQNSREEGT